MSAPGNQSENLSSLKSIYRFSMALSLSLSNYVIERVTTITFARLDYLTVTRLNYTHELINKLGQESNLTRHSLNFCCKAIEFGLLVINQIDKFRIHFIYKLNHHIWRTECRVIEGDLQEKIVKKINIVYYCFHYFTK